MSEVWRFTGPPENWLTAFGISKWALNDNNKLLWEKDIRPGDVVFFHSTKHSDFSDRAISSIVGLGYVGEGMSVKKDLWWVQEIKDQTNHWPYVVPLREVYLFSDVEAIDFRTPVDKKPAGQMKADIDLLIARALPINDLNARALKRDPKCPQFPVNGSASRVNRIFEELILEHSTDFFIPHEDQGTDLLEERLSESVDEQLSGLDKGTILAQARAFDNSLAESYYISHNPKKVRKESQIQKRRVAALENYACQLCGFKCEYLKANGKKGWIIQVDHTVDKVTCKSEDFNEGVVRLRDGIDGEKCIDRPQRLALDSDDGGRCNCFQRPQIGFSHLRCDTVIDNSWRIQNPLPSL